MLHTKKPSRAAWVIFCGAAAALLACCEGNPKDTPLRPAAPAASRTIDPVREAEPWSGAWLQMRATRYLEDQAHRRESMLRSLRNHKNLYSRQRIASYGHGSKGWDALPIWNPKSEVLRVIDGEKRSLEPRKATDRVWDGARPTTLDEWRELGRRVFHRYPLRADEFVHFGVKDAARMARFGLHKDRNGSVPGVVRFSDVDGRNRVGITCALCHTSVRNGESLDGVARRDFDYGALRLKMHERTKTPVDPELARRMASWGPGRADITEDEAEDPVTIPDLWDLQDYDSLTQAGTIRQIGPIALALRQETQLLHANHQRARPPRELSWALAMYLYSLRPAARSANWEPPEATEVEAGKSLFEEHCSRCHSNPSGGGSVVDAVKLGTDQALAWGTARGTGKYRPPNLTRVGDAAPYFHTGALPTLEALFDRRRFARTYRQANGKRGAVPGHDYGLQWEKEDKKAMIAYLESL